MTGGYYTHESFRPRTTADRSEGSESPEPELRPLEDPYLVGEVAAAKARSERLARENGDDILIREDRQWDWFLGKTPKHISLDTYLLRANLLANSFPGQMKDWGERERSWKEFRREVDNRNHRKLLGLGRIGTGRSRRFM